MFYKYHCILLCKFTSYQPIVISIGREAATALSKRHVDGSLPIEDFNIELENQGGQKVQLGTEPDQRYGIYS